MLKYVEQVEVGDRFLFKLSMAMGGTNFVVGSEGGWVRVVVLKVHGLYSKDGWDTVHLLLLASGDQKINVHIETHRILDVEPEGGVECAGKFGNVEYGSLMEEQNSDRQRA